MWSLWSQMHKAAVFGQLQGSQECFGIDSKWSALQKAHGVWFYAQQPCQAWELP